MTEAIAETTSGRIRGFTEESASVFLGVPFAAPPVGEHRFRAPAPPSSWDGVRDVLRYGPTAPQRDPGMTIIPEPVERGDDFLNLNVYTPDLGDARLPVLVWIHGGGFVSGCNRSPWYRGTRFARDGVVVVNVGYRLGVEGFLDIEDALPNRAVLDWICALEWVRDNIANFGGDPSKVTIAGQSAGSAACLILMTNPRARGLLHRVIAMSGTSDTRMPRDSAKELTAKLAAHLGVKPTREELSRFTPDDLVEAQAGIALNPFSAEGVTAGFDARTPALKPFVDGEVIPQHPFRAIRSGVGSDIPLLTGCTTQELNGGVQMRRKELEGVAAGALDAMKIDVDAYRPLVGSDDPVDLLAQALTDRAFRANLAKLLEDRNHGPTWGYQFAWHRDDPKATAMHCIDIPFAWDNLDAEGVTDKHRVGEGAPQSLADEMHAEWVRFIETGDPGWARYPDVKTFDVPSHIDADPLGPLRELF